MEKSIKRRSFLQNLTVCVIMIRRKYDPVDKNCFISHKTFHELCASFIYLFFKDGNTYIRWGRSDCPAVNGTSLVYSGKYTLKELSI